VPLELGALGQGMAGILVFQGAGFLASPRPLPLREAETVLEQSLGRVFLLYAGVAAGVVLAAFVERWFVVPFILLKTVVDFARLR
jgi:hypothetical protein